MDEHDDDDVRENILMIAAKKRRSRRPGDSKFKQQRLKAWKPTLSPSNVLPTYFIVGIIFTIIGSSLLKVTDDAIEIIFDYTNCVSINPNDGGQSCADVIQNNFAYRNTSTLYARCSCEQPFNVTGLGGEKVFLYYLLENFYQNHRRYVRSRDDFQLRGQVAQGNEDCEPFITRNNKYYSPCGLIANSLFNDTIRIFRRDDAAELALIGEGIAWDSDRKVKFKNPPSLTDNVCDATIFASNASLRPPNWPVDACQLGSTDVITADNVCNASSNATGDFGCLYNPWSAYFNSNGVGYENEDFIVWMRTALNKNFRKLWRRIPDGVTDGEYVARIDYNFPVSSFDGKKHFMLGTTTAFGGKRQTLPVLYLVMGIFCIVAGFAFIFMQHCGGLLPRWCRPWPRDSGIPHTPSMSPQRPDPINMQPM
eukprot:m.620182 g.620182  ORF g.620182 m.620182 type:complete len:423 (+) comp22532_c0_seq2:205-1473(+)